VSATRRHGGRLIADALVAHGCDLVFCVPGESYLPLLDGLGDHRDRVRVVTCRHESAAANAAEASGKLTGRPGICLVTRGPGATQAAVGVHTARQDSTPMILFVGQVARSQLGREAFQEIDCDKVFGSLAKAVVEIRSVERIPELVAHAYSVACSGRPGPVVVELPEDVLSEETDVADARPHVPVEPQPAAGDLERLTALLQQAERPLVMVGGGPWDVESTERLRAWAEACDLPVCASFRRQDIFDNDHLCYVGDAGLGINPRLRERLETADLLIAVGTRLTDTETQGYTAIRPPVPAQTLVHVHPDPDELGRVFQPDLAVISGMRPFASAVAAGVRVDGSRWASWRETARADYEVWSTPGAAPADGDGVDLGAVIATLRDALPDDAVLCNGAGNYTVWAHRFFRYRGFGTQLAPQSGAMGYGIPAAMAAQLVHPERTAVAFEGDGCFQMCGQELATIVQEQLPVVVIVANNGMLGTIRMHQERRFPGRVVATDLANPDFTALARAYGLTAERVTSTEEFPAALRRALDAGGPALLELVTSSRVLTPSVVLDAAGRL
jgi:acetolactate synthase-1/2/3 large subunit